jgi:hypothetical protein
LKTDGSEDNFREFGMSFFLSGITFPMNEKFGTLTTNNLNTQNSTEFGDFRREVMAEIDDSVRWKQCEPLGIEKVWIALKFECGG